MKDRFLDLQLRLLVLQYGKRAVHDALIRLNEQSVDRLDTELRPARDALPKMPSRRSTGLADVASTETSNRPDVADLVSSLAVRFEIGEFLPRLRDVQRLLDRLDVQPRKLRSRREAGPALVRVLAKLTREELVQIAVEHKSSDGSDYSLLARAIMRPASDKQRSAKR